MSRADLIAACQAVEDEAAGACGLSDVLYEARVQAGYAMLLDQAADVDHAATEVVLRERGFEPDQEAYASADDECWATGINARCCPRGRHP